MIPSDLVMKIGNLDNYKNKILIATDNIDFGITNINNKLLLPLIPKPDDLSIIKNYDFIKPDILINNNKNLIENNDSIYKDYHETKYILPLIVCGSIRLIIYFIK